MFILVKKREILSVLPKLNSRYTDRYMKNNLVPDGLDLQAALPIEKQKLEKVNVPIVTVSATFRKELADRYQTTFKPDTGVVYSRAHYSMAEAVRRQALLMDETTHMVDPTNFVDPEKWNKIEFTEKVALLVARYGLLKWLKDKVDTVVRSKMPISGPITEPLLYLFQDVKKTILSMHYESGNILVRNGKKVLEVVTDPHVRPQYLECLPSDKIDFAVFDEATRNRFFELAKELGKTVKEDQVVVTGSPVDPRISALGKVAKKISANKPINLVITAGGLGTNRDEIIEILKQFAPMLRPPEKIRLFLNAGVHKDFRAIYEKYAKDNNVRIGNLDDEEARIRVLYEDSIIDNNENLIKYAFPWADGFITKPSGDMAYEAAAAGCFMLFLEPWGEWEENIQKIFIENGVAVDFNVADAKNHFEKLLELDKLQLCLDAAHNLPPIFREGSKNILKMYLKNKA